MAKRAEEAKPQSTPAASTRAAADKTSGWHDSWVAELAGDGCDVPSVVGLFGYLSPAPEPGRVRLYCDPHLLQAVEIAVEDILHREAVPKSVSPLGGSFLWIPSSVWAQTVIFYRQN